MLDFNYFTNALNQLSYLSFYLKIDERDGLEPPTISLDFQFIKILLLPTLLIFNIY